MQSRDQKYKAAVGRNIKNLPVHAARHKEDDVSVVRRKLGIRATDTSFDQLIKDAQLSAGRLVKAKEKEEKQDKTEKPDQRIPIPDTRLKIKTKANPSKS